MWQPAWLRLIEAQKYEEEQAAQGKEKDPEEEEIREALKGLKVEHGERRPGNDPIPK